MGFQIKGTRQAIGLALAVVFLVNAVTILATLFTIRGQKQDAVKIDLAGRQWMLSQKMAKEALLLASGAEGDWKSQLSDSAALFDKTLRGLRNGDPSLGIEAARDPAILKTLDALEANWQPARAAVETLLSSPPESPSFKGALATVATSNTELLRLADSLTEAYDTQTADVVVHLEWLLAVMFALSLLVLFAVLAIVNRTMAQPLEQAIAVQDDLAKGRLRRSATAKGLGEVQRMVLATNAILYGIGHQFLLLKEQGLTLAAASKNLEIAGETIHGGAEDLEHTAQGVANASREAAESLEAVSKATQELNTAAVEIAQSVAETARITNTAQQKATDTNAVIGRLEESSEKIGGILGLINAIAEQTNLLALNATIEAARAGEAGKGFAVVANEIKELAKQTAAATEEISTVLQTIRGDTQQAVTSVEGITAIVAQVNDLANTIASAAEEQTATVSEVSERVQHGAAKADHVREQATGMVSDASDFAQVASILTAVQEALGNVAKGWQTVSDFYEVDPDALRAAETDVGHMVRLKTVVLQHYIWSAKVLRAVFQGEAPDVETDPTRCGLGRWLTGYRPGSDTESQVLKDLIPVHDQLHKSVIKTQQAIRSGQGGTAALQLLNREIQPLLVRVVDDLRRLLKAME